MIEITASSFLQGRDERLHPPSFMLLRWKLICQLSYGCVVHASDLVGNWMKCSKLVPVCHGRLIGLYVDGVLTARVTQHRGLGSSSVCSNTQNIAWVSVRISNSYGSH